MGRTCGDAAHSGRLVVLRIEKQFSKFERLLAKVLRAPAEVRRPLDAMNSLVWELSDGKHAFEEIVHAMDATFHEEAAPVVERVNLSLQKFRDLGLMRFGKDVFDGSWSTDPGRVPAGQGLTALGPDLDAPLQ